MNEAFDLIKEKSGGRNVMLSYVKFRITAKFNLNNFLFSHLTQFKPP